MEGKSQQGGGSPARFSSAGRANPGTSAESRLGTVPPVPRRARSDPRGMPADVTLAASHRFAMVDEARSDSDALGVTGGVPASFAGDAVKRTKTPLVGTRATPRAEGRGAQGAEGADAGGLTLADAQRLVDRRRAEARAEAVRLSTRPVAAHPPARATTSIPFRDDDATTWTSAGATGVAPRVERAVDASGLAASMRSYSNIATGAIALLTPASSMQDVRRGDDDPRGDEGAAGERLAWRGARGGSNLGRPMAHRPRRWRWWAVLFAVATVELTRRWATGLEVHGRTHLQGGGGGGGTHAVVRKGGG